VYPLETLCDLGRTSEKIEPKEIARFQVFHVRREKKEERKSKKEDRSQGVREMCFIWA